MTALLFPQLPPDRATDLARAYTSLEPSILLQQAADRHESEVYSPTGGRQVSRAELDALARDVRLLQSEARARVAEHLQSEADSKLAFDAGLARLLHTRMALSRSEASKDGVWAFLGCVLLPDIVRWRFASGETPPDRFIGGSRGVRNTLGRCWWRGELLFDRSPPRGRDNYWVVDELGEDELTGIIERQRAISSRRVAVALGRALVETDCKGIPRMNVARDMFKRFLRLGYFLAFDGLDDGELEVACHSLCRRSVKALRPTDSIIPQKS